MPIDSNPHKYHLVPITAIACYFKNCIGYQFTSV